MRVLVRSEIVLGGVLAFAMNARAQTSSSPPPASPAPSDEQCASPRVAVDREQHCCAPGQHFANGHCEGNPAVCPPGMAREANAATCTLVACSDGRTRIDDTYCCWPGQHLSRDGTACAGDVHTCPEGTTRVSPDDCTPRVGPRREHSPIAIPRTAVWVSGGTFRMGFVARPVTLQPFAIDRTEVTVAAYAACVRAGRCEAAHDTFSPSGTANLPRAQVTFGMARQYCGFVNGRLPTEAEWELAARGFDRRVYPWGVRLPDCSLAHFAGCAAGPAPVATLSAGASPFGALDLAGNLAEWVSDRGGALPSESATDPTGPDEGDTRVVRGGSFDDGPNAIRTDARREIDPREARYDIGFRCVY